MGNISLKEQLEAVAAQLKQSNVKQTTQAKQRQVPSPRSANKQTKKSSTVVPKWLEYVLRGVLLLKTHFPACFRASHEIQPLKKGIKQDLVKYLSTIDTITPEDKACMIKSVAYYVNKGAYHKSVKENATRIDLHGQPSGVVSAAEAMYSLERQQAKSHAKQAKPVHPQTNPKETASLL